MLTFSELQREVKTRALRNQSGTEFDASVKNAINSAILRLSREALWRPMRRKTSFLTVTGYSSGSNYMSVTAGSTTTTGDTGTNWILNKVEVGRTVKFGTDGGYYTIRAIYSGSNEAIIIDRPYEGTTSTATTYNILPKEEYVIPMQSGHRMFLWHEDYGYPFLMEFITDQNFFRTGVYRTTESIPIAYRMWGEDMVITQPPTASNIGIVSTAIGDSSTNVTIFGNVAGYPRIETVTTSGASGAVTVSTTNKFDSVERVAIGSNTNGTFTISSIYGGYTLAVIPAGNAGGVLRKKVQLYPLPNSIFPINVYYYKAPFPLTNDEDIHELGGDFDEAIILLATARIKYQDSQKEGDRFAAMYQDELRNLRKTNMDKPDWKPVLEKPSEGTPMVQRFLRYDQIGPYYGFSQRI